ncbi:hypothetical protein [Pseudolactococcus insecticola]|uniref:Uncharacterized protein n=1 Tax=Pseudolactococcus insecticola TaxID=2709158 RepID=A0A6A0B7L5_9LACT|nr:hypothetical protein [Lactococcus insecticola]GFH41409.1 hypothetical protein Hs20B_18070 [Lactococcus insecticola]
MALLLQSTAKHNTIKQSVIMKQNNMLVEELKNLRSIINGKLFTINEQSAYLNDLDTFNLDQAGDFEYYNGLAEGYIEVQKEISNRIIELKTKM